MGRWPAAWPKSVHMIGVGGVAMSGLAAVLARAGTRVRGSDRAVYPPASTMLELAGIELRTPFDRAHLEPFPELVVVGNAISRGNVELEGALENQLQIASLPEVIERLLVPGRRVSVVAGTHGKTTTTSMLAWIHHATGRDPTFLIGGQPGNFDVGARLGSGHELILEGDEYDSCFFDKGPKFLHYWPRIAILGPVEFDHADIYSDLAAVERSFELLTRLIPRDGVLIAHQHPVTLRVAAASRAPVQSCGTGSDADWCILDRQDQLDGQSFLLQFGGHRHSVQLAIAGEHNALNATAAIAAAHAAAIPLDQALAAISSFRPPKRRLELLAELGGIRLIDDFAHHPTAIEQTLRTLRSLVPSGGRLIACVEPRSNTMVRTVFATELSAALALADRVLLGAIDRPERFQAGEALDIATLCRTIRERGADANGPLTPEQIETQVTADWRAGDCIVVMSNGAFGGLAQRLRQRLQR